MEEESIEKLYSRYLELEEEYENLSRKDRERETIENEIYALREEIEKHQDYVELHHKYDKILAKA